MGKCRSKAQVSSQLAAARGGGQLGLARLCKVSVDLKDPWLFHVGRRNIQMQDALLQSRYGMHENLRVKCHYHLAIHG